MKFLALPAFQDNYLWLLHDGQRAVVVDPGDAHPVLAGLQQDSLQLEAILVTHHHRDHVGGVAALHAATGAKVFGPAREAIPQPLQPLQHGQRIEVLGQRFEVIDVPGHTAGHIAYYAEDIDGAPRLFCGDTLFSGGCGRVFEGTPAQMLASLDALAALPPDTQVYCAHEYTLSNLRFACAVEPANAALAAYMQACQALRAQNRSTLPSHIGLELRINPFLRSREPAVAQAAHLYNGADPADAVAVFAAIRQWKNEFQ